MEPETFFSDGSGVLRVVVSCIGAYAGVVLLVRLFGKRTLAQLNAFDWIVTVAFGSTLATTVLDEGVALAEGLAAFATLAALQFGVTFVSTRVPWVQRLLKNEPRLLVHRGEPVREALRAERIGQEDILQVLRSSGAASVRSVEAVVFETNGQLSVLLSADAAQRDTLENVVGTEGGSSGGRSERG